MIKHLNTRTTVERFEVIKMSIIERGVTLDLGLRSEGAEFSLQPGNGDSRTVVDFDTAGCRKVRHRAKLCKSSGDPNGKKQTQRRFCRVSSELETRGIPVEDTAYFVAQPQRLKAMKRWRKRENSPCSLSWIPIFFT